MRPLAALLLVLLAPSASAATQVHATYTGDAYVVTFAADAEPPVVSAEGAPVVATRVSEPTGDDDRLYRAVLPPRAVRYEIDGRSFALPAPPARDATTRVAFVGDVGTDENASAVLAAILRAKPDLVLFGGDLSYANGNASVWNDWFALVEPLAANLPAMPVYGNHEDYCVVDDTLRHCGPDANAWHAHFALPNRANLFYGFTWGPIRFTVLDTEAYVAGDPATDAREQAAFANASFGRDEAAWDVAVFHRPLRTTNQKEGLESEEVRAALEPLLAPADLALAAHVHGYERSAAARNATLFVTSGGGGRELYHDWGPMEPWLAKRASEHHFLLLEASPTRLVVSALRVDGSTLDRVTIERPDPKPPTPSTTPGTPPTATTSTPAAPSPDGAIVESRETPAPGLLAFALVLAITLSRRRTRRRVRG